MEFEDRGYGPFDGDGRRKIHPPEAFTLRSRNPAPMTRGTARLIIDNFTRTGLSNHSAACSTLWVILWWCEYYNREYVMVARERGCCVFLDNIPPGVNA